jgi:hypothetical protein
MLASPNNRSRFNIDNPRYADGFWTARGFKMRRVSGKSGGRMWRRQLRAAEKRTLAARRLQRHQVTCRTGR